MPPRQRMTRAEREERAQYEALHAKYGAQPSRRERRSRRDDDDDDSPLLVLSGRRADSFLGRIFGDDQDDDDQDDDDQDDDDQDDDDQDDDDDDQPPPDPNPNSRHKFFR